MRTLHLLCGVCSLPALQWEFGMHCVDSCSSQGGIRTASYPSSSEAEGAGWEMGWAGSTEQILCTDLKPFLPILPVFVKRDLKKMWGTSG